MIYWLYEKLLLRRLTVLPEHLCFMITEQDMLDAPEKIVEVSGWCREVGIRGVTFHISTNNAATIDPFLPFICRIADFARLELHGGDRDEVLGEGMPVLVAVGHSGREEITGCIRGMAKDGVAPDRVDEDLIDRYLTFRYTPDLVIKTGASHLTDFLIWQSVYSELFFSDVNWRLFRKVDFLRALRDYQARKRRFGS
ncbi:MAG TPA: undecaprenyl diphosphate synthase family protein [Methanomicrobiales archaeon]|nr:undecaprenyl diphosphate synthase family protein [Methanomicrobiales archaeon]